MSPFNLATGRPLTFGTTANSASSESQVASVRIAPGQVPAANCGAGTGTTPCDLIDATVLTAQTSANCTNGLHATASIATLSIAGNPVLTGGEVPANTEISLSAGTEAQTLAAVILNFERPPFAEAPDTAGAFLPPSALPANEAQASPVVVNFPHGGALSPLVTGTLFVSYAQSDISGCSAPNPSPSASPGATPSPTGSPSATPSPAASPSATPSPEPSASASPCAGSDSDDSQEEQHESSSAQAHESCHDESQEECHESAQAEAHENDGHAHDGTVDCPETSTGATPAGLVLTPRNDIGLAAFALLLLLAAFGWRPRVKIGWKR